YHVNGYTKYINPLKLNEYLAAGCPVVGVPIPSIEAFTDVVRVARTEPEWSAAIAASLGPEDTSAQRIAARQAVARRLGWSQQTYRVAKAMCARLAASDVRHPKSNLVARRPSRVAELQSPSPPPFNS